MDHADLGLTDRYRLSPSERYNRRRGRYHKKLTNPVRRMTLLLHQCLPKCTKAIQAAIGTMIIII
jgi:hypothetical protein